MNYNDQEFLIQKIRTQYTEKQPSAVDELRELDARVKRPANVFAYVFGSIAAVVMGGGMSLVMTDIAEQIGMTGDTMMMGIVIGVVGLVLSLVNYPMYKGILNARKKKYALRVLELSDRIMERK